MGRGWATLGAVAALAAAGPAQAQAPDAGSAALARCVALKTTGADRLLVARWFTAVLASAAQAADVATLKPGVKPDLDRSMAKVFTRLMTVDCVAEVKKLQATGKGQASFSLAGEALGRVAMEELLNEPQAKQAVGAFAQYIDPKDFEGVMAK